MQVTFFRHGHRKQFLSNLCFCLFSVSPFTKYFDKDISTRQTAKINVEQRNWWSNSEQAKCLQTLHLISWIFQVAEKFSHLSFMVFLNEAISLGKMATTPIESFSLVNCETVHVHRSFGDFTLCMIYVFFIRLFSCLYFFNSSQYHSCKKKELNSCYVCVGSLRLVLFVLFLWLAVEISVYPT